MHFQDLPPAPYCYEDVTAFAFIAEDPNGDSWIAGKFPRAPTGAFSEVWKLKRIFTAWTPQTIVVDNPVRMEAGRAIWNLPKILGEVVLRGGGDTRYVSVTTKIGTTDLIVRARGAQQSRTFGGKFDLALPGGLTATLKFQPSKLALPALLTAAGKDRPGYLFDFSGTAELTAPAARADAA
ncbi:hypothetical protein ABIF07_000235 [Bradyrhizobium elkanii]|uniref:acetoacetate decarboxylase family protein n=1 Tax=Bradyrhizobium elkanii TaxID=29448 RepID=UPI00216A70A4|nr:acetoacetate decarboxylase family protein [Bradyrhizobium elkanii]MCS3695037.1 hypothetical protein [Bradyrhizobium elkanii]